MVAAHDANTSSHYVEHWPDHTPREHDPHKHLFDAYHRRFKDTAKCYVGERIGAEHCAPGPLELHHAHLEESAKNAVTWQAVAHDYPQVDDDEALAEWVESEPNFRWLCSWHHRSAGAGAHHVTHSDWECGTYSASFLTQYDQRNP